MVFFVVVVAYSNYIVLSTNEYICVGLHSFVGPRAGDQLKYNGLLLVGGSLKDPVFTRGGRDKISFGQSQRIC